jgi:cardiolipin synthase
MPVFSSGSRGDTEVVTDRFLTVPNLLSLARLLALPFIYFDTTTGREGRALVLLVVVSWSDWIDGYVARRFNQVSRLGRLLDPISDRLLVATVGIAFIVVGIMPLWAVLLVLARDAFMLAGVALLLTRGKTPPPVTDLGKTATFGLMLAFPLFLLAHLMGSVQLRLSAWNLFASVAFLYYLAAGQYVVMVARDLRR